MSGEQNFLGRIIPNTVTMEQAMEAKDIIDSRKIPFYESDLAGIKTDSTEAPVGSFLLGVREHPFHPPSYAPDRAGRVFFVLMMKKGDKPEILTTDTRTIWDTPQSSTLNMGTPEQQWKKLLHECEQQDPNIPTDERWQVLAWAWEPEANAYFLGMFYRTPQPVLDYIDTCKEPTSTKEYETL